MATAIGYVRVSTDKQAEKGMSLEAQEARIRGWVASQVVDLLRIEVDQVSAKDTNRPGLKRVMEAVARHEADCVVVVKLDRMTRSVRDLADLMDRFNAAGVEFASIVETLDSHSAAGRLVMNIIATVGQWERETIGERTREAMRHLKENGRVAGNIPYGKRRAEGKLLEDEPSEQVVLRRIRELRDLGETHRGIAETLNAEGFKTRKGTEWKHQYIANLVREVKQSLPPYFKIVQAWKHEGRFVPDLYTPHCFACLRPRLLDHSGDNWEHAWSSAGLERCHIIGKSIGGSYDPANLVLLCPRCHRDAPMTNNRELMLTWMRNREDFWAWAIRDCFQAAHELGMTAEDVRDAIHLPVEELSEEMRRLQVDRHPATSRITLAPMTAAKSLLDRRRKPVDPLRHAGVEELLRDCVPISTIRDACKQGKAVI